MVSQVGEMVLTSASFGRPIASTSGEAARGLRTNAPSSVSGGPGEREKCNMFSESLEEGESSSAFLFAEGAFDSCMIDARGLDDSCELEWGHD